jgi:propanediol dehydratase small subunit
MSSDYPLSVMAADRLKTATGRMFEEVTLEAVLDGSVTIDDLRVSAEALELQAQIAEKANRPQLAANLRRAAELVNVPDQKVLEIYNALRPGRATPEQLTALADELERECSAPRCAALLRDAVHSNDRQESQ